MEELETLDCADSEKRDVLPSQQAVPTHPPPVPSTIPHTVPPAVSLLVPTHHPRIPVNTCEPGPAGHHQTANTAVPVEGDDAEPILQSKQVCCSI